MPFGLQPPLFQHIRAKFGENDIVRVHRQIYDWCQHLYRVLKDTPLLVSHQFDSGTTLALTTSFAAVPNLSISVPVLTGDIVEANMIADLRIVTGATAQTNALPEAKMAIDGVVQAQSAFLWTDRVEPFSNYAWIVSQNYRFVATADTTHTLTVHGKYGGTALVAGASASVDGAHTSLIVKVFRTL